MRMAIALLVLVCIFGCAGKKDHPGKVRVEFRLAETQPGEGLEEMTLLGGDERFYLHEEVRLTNTDIASAYATMRQQRPTVELYLTEAGSQRFADLTEKNVTKRVGMLVDGRLVSAPVIRAPIREGKALITGDFSMKEAERIAAGIAVK